MRGAEGEAVGTYRDPSATKQTGPPEGSNMQPRFFFLLNFKVAADLMNRSIQGVDEETTP